MTQDQTITRSWVPLCQCSPRAPPASQSFTAHGLRTGHVRDFVTPSRNRKCFPPANGYSYVMRSWIKLEISGVQSSVNIQRVP